MSFTREALGKFKKIYYEKFGEEILDQRALDLATELINLYKAVYKPNKK